MTSEQSEAKRVYEASDGHKTVVALVFLILLPFLVSLPVMILKRSLHGLWSGALSATILGILLGGAMLFLFIEVMSAFRTRVELGERSVKLRVPRWRGPTPGLKFVKREIPYDALNAVETRGEIYEAAKIPVLTRATYLVTKDGERLTLGYVNENEEDPDVPFTRIAKELAEQAEVPLKDIGKVHAGSQLKALRKGPPPIDSEPLSEEDFAEFRRRNHWLMFGMAMLLFGLTAIGILIDLYRAGYFNFATSS